MGSRDDCDFPSLRELAFDDAEGVENEVAGVSAELHSLSSSIGGICSEADVLENRTLLRRGFIAALVVMLPSRVDGSVSGTEKIPSSARAGRHSESSMTVVAGSSIAA